MRAASTALKTLLNNNNQQFVVDLVTLDLVWPLGVDSNKGVAAGVKFSGGTTCKWTSGDTDLTLGAATFSHLGPTMARGGVRHSKGAAEVGTMTLALGGGWTFPANSTKIQTAAINGYFDGAWVKVERLFMATWGDTSAGTINWFEGLVSTVEPSSTAVKLTFKDPRATLDQNYPRRLYQPGCPYVLFDLRCALTKTVGTNAWADGVVIASPAPTALSVSMTANKATGLYSRGTVTFTGTGPLAGYSRTVIADTDNGGTTHTFTFAAPLPSVPQAGDTFSYTLGCDGLLTTCVGKFNNGSRFGGFPFVPKPESVR